MIERHGSGAPWEPTVGYSRVVRAGDHVHVAGCTALSEDGVVLGGASAYDQARQALANIERGRSARPAQRSPTSCGRAST